MAPRLGDASRSCRYEKAERRRVGQTMSQACRVGDGAMWSLRSVPYPETCRPVILSFSTIDARQRVNGLMSPAAEAPALEALERELVQLLGHEGVSTSPGVRRKASIDGSTMSPILAPQLPIGLADIVAFPKSAEQIAVAVAVATRYEVPVTHVGRGTGNYGQGLPLMGGLVLDTSRARAITEVADGYITAEAGTPMVQLERAATERGQQLWMYPSTVQSSIGGFLSGGSAGTRDHRPRRHVGRLRACPRRRSHQPVTRDRAPRRPRRPAVRS